jgi:parallel beta-helix repeat protein
MLSRTVLLIAALVCLWCAPPARAAVPYDDSSAAPAGYEAICAMPKYPVFDVRAYGAKGDGKADDTVAVRSAIAAAVDGGQGGIVFFPAGTYAVCPQSDDQPIGLSRPIFTLGGRQNLVFLGAGAGRSILKGYCAGLADPVKNWKVTGDGYFKISRFGMFYLAGSGGPTTGIQFRSLVIDGNLPYTGNSAVGGIRETGDGWDMSHKAITCNGPGTVDQILIFNCAIKNWRGEEVYAGGSTIGRMHVINGSIRGCNASAMSCSANINVVGVAIGGTAAGDDVYNGVENFAFAPGQQTTLVNCTIQCSSKPKKVHGNGIVLLGNPPWKGAPGTSATIKGCTIANNHFGILFSETDHNVTISGNTFRNNVNAMINSVLGLYHGNPSGFSNFTITGNTFNSTGTAFINQGQTINGLVISNNTLNGLGSRLIGGKFPNRQTGFVVSNNTLGEGTSDVQNPLPAGVQTIPLWSGTTRPEGIATSGNKFDDFSNASSTRIIPWTDRTWLNDNMTPVESPHAATLDPSVKGLYPPGFATTFVLQAKSNWVLPADPTWNTWTKPLAVTYGLKIEVNAKGLFTVSSAP